MVSIIVEKPDSFILLRQKKETHATKIAPNWL
jgi:hypothetical protein